MSTEDSLAHSDIIILDNNSLVSNEKDDHVFENNSDKNIRISKNVKIRFTGKCKVCKVFLYWLFQ